ncbi:MAG: hypothetical protein P8Y67_00530 [Alphaproteobacteria bacterium]
MRKLSKWIWVQAAAIIAVAFTVQKVLAQSKAEIEKAAADVVRAQGLQTEIIPAAKHTNNWNTEKFLDVTFDFLPVTLLDWIIYGAVAIVIALFIYTFREYIYLPAIARRGVTDWKEEGNENGANAPTSAKEAEITADELARNGHYAEAMHVLLLRAVAELRLRLKEHYADSMTSREILWRAGISENGRQAFQDIVSRVEWTYFGSYPAEMNDYQACRDNFIRLIGGLQNVARA